MGPSNEGYRRVVRAPTDR